MGGDLETIGLDTPTVRGRRVEYQLATGADKAAFETAITALADQGYVAVNFAANAVNLYALMVRIKPSS